MIVAIHQPNYLPWSGYFYKIAKADIFVLLDNVQYEKNGYTNRCQMKTSQGAQWLTMPIEKKFPQLITKAKLINFPKECKRHLKTIQLNYKKTEYFNDLFPDLKQILEKDWKYLSELNIELIKFLIKKIGIKTKIEIASNYNFQGKSTDLLINICKRFNAKTYLSGKGGANYQDEKKFETSKIDLEYTNFDHPIYSQLWGEFIPGLSVIDLLFNYGSSSIKILLGQE